MKKMITLCLLSCLLCISGCNNVDKQSNDNTMYIKPTEFSEETLEVLELFDDEIHFFDVSINDTVKSHKISVWVYRDGEWHEDGKIYGQTEFLANRYAIRLTETSCELYSIDENGHTTTKYPELDTEFENTTAKIGWKLDYEKTIELNEEIPLWVLIGSNATSFQTSDMEKDFREVECSAGIAITITLSDKTIE